MYLWCKNNPKEDLYWLDCSPFFSSQKQNRGGNHNYAAAEKKVLVIFPKTDGEAEVGGKAHLIHSS